MQSKVVRPHPADSLFADVPDIIKLFSEGDSPELGLFSDVDATSKLL
jgi:hypothetical protein